jgi:hypothetical protein
MRPNLKSPLSREEFESLQELGRGLMQRVIPKAHNDRLIDLGYAKELLGGTGLTNEGRARIAMGK